MRSFGSESFLRRRVLLRFHSSGLEVFELFALPALPALLVVLHLLAELTVHAAGLCL